MFKKNLDLQGRIIRLLIAFIVLLYAILYSSWIAYAVSVFVFLEALFSWCAFYQLTGKNSCPVEAPKKEEK
ncbi:YgaP family membrane protein [Criblamydia sequanensis]|uniref:Conserved putative secreted protein n=1 Tax=Candidatus Criblamydia sequanensis CRIB-18 TaxID=1437425 RepID=A0A090D0V6_9BACT|nr:DUF2892 domain-containing protein [Criblamydia sequanensis]CDR35182.1 Conserved putative secreted protein [Criblamydia sequanensis CRIB-18]